MYVSKVIIEGFMPFKGKHEITFEAGQVIGITGQYGEDFSKSNRAGKSSFIDAIVWGLFGKSRAKKEIELIFTGNEETRVTTFLKSEDNEVSITRWRDSGNKGGTELVGHEGEKKAATQAEIDKLIGLTYEEFLFTAFFKQDDIDQFMKADAQKKKQILMRWIQTNNWGTYEDSAAEFRKELVRNQTGIKGKLQGLPEEDIDIESLHKEMAEITKRKTEGIAPGVLDLNKKILALDLQLQELNQTFEIKNKIIKFENEINHLKSQRPDNTNMKASEDALRSNIAKYPTIDKTKYEEAIDKKDKHTSTLAELRTKYSQTASRMKKAQQDMTGVCPITNESCDQVALSQEQLNEWKKELIGYKTQADKIKELKEKCEKIIKLHQHQKDWESKLLLLEEKKKLSANLEKGIADKTKEMIKLQESLPQDIDGRKRKVNEAKQGFSDQKADLEIELETLERRVGTIGELIRQQKTKEERMAGIKKDLSGINQQLADAKWVEYMFGKNGIPSIELENSFQEIENDANMILKNLQAPFHIEFEATRQLDKWEPSCLACDAQFKKGERTHICENCGTPREKKRRDELSLRMFEGGNERPYYLDSGGGQILQAIALRLALTQLARRRNGSGWGTLFLDELFGKLDESNRQLVSELIVSTLRQLGFEQIFVISHDPNIQSSLSNQLIIRRNQEENYSEVIYNEV